MQVEHNIIIESQSTQRKPNSSDGTDKNLRAVMPVLDLSVNLQARRSSLPIKGSSKNSESTDAKISLSPPVLPQPYRCMGINEQQCICAEGQFAVHH